MGDRTGQDVWVRRDRLGSGGILPSFGMVHRRICHGMAPDTFPGVSLPGVSRLGGLGSPLRLADGQHPKLSCVHEPGIVADVVDDGEQGVLVLTHG